jgi:GNAT superfamily N-acetyltransferase
MGQVPGAVERPAPQVPAVVGVLPAVLPDDVGLSPDVRWDAWPALTPDAVTGVLALRGAAAPEAADLDPAARLAWVDDETGPVAALRVRPVPDDDTVDADGADRTAWRVEALVVRGDVAHLGLGGALLVAAVARAGGRAVVADVPDDAAPVFARLGFAQVADVVDVTGEARLRRLRRAPDAPWREA